MLGAEEFRGVFHPNYIVIILQFSVMAVHILFWSVGSAGQRFVSRVDPGLCGLDGAGDQENSVLSRIVLPVKTYIHVKTT